MKQHLFSALFLLALAGFSSCKKDADTTPADQNQTTDTGGPYVSYKVNGNTVNIKDANLAYAQKSGSQYAVYGVIAGGATVTLTLKQSLGTGTFAFKSPDAYGFYNDSNQTPFFTHFGNGSGTITIEAYDNTHVKGTFQFTAYNNADLSLKTELSEGKFDVLFKN
jgi:uncharacterized surface anchored protein